MASAPASAADKTPKRKLKGEGKDEKEKTGQKVARVDAGIPGALMYVVMAMCDDRLAPRKFPLKVFSDLAAAKAFVDRYVDPEGEPRWEVYHRNLQCELYNKPFYCRDGDAYLKDTNSDEDDEVEDDDAIEKKYAERERQYKAFLAELKIDQRWLWSSVTRIGIDTCAA